MRETGRVWSLLYHNSLGRHWGQPKRAEQSALSVASSGRMEEWGRGMLTWVWLAIFGSCAPASLSLFTLGWVQNKVEVIDE